MSAKFTAQDVRAPMLVALLGIEARLASNDEPEIDRAGPLTEPVELSQEEWQLHAFRNEGLL